MNIAIILAGGTGVRIGGDIPKQYIEVSGKPIISYCLNKYDVHKQIDSIVVVASEIWQDYIIKWIEKDKIKKFSSFAPAGSSRQHSILNGLIKAKDIGAKENDNVIIHDAARPNVSEYMISQCLDCLSYYDAVMPVLPVKDTIYLSENGKSITSLLNRDQLYAGQAPESFKFGKYFNLHNGMTEDNLAHVRGSSELAYSNGLNIHMIAGDEHNYKITTKEDLVKFIKEMEES